MKMPNLHTHVNARARGRLTKLDVTVQVTITIALARGSTMTVACREAGIGLGTAMERLARGRGEDPQRPCTPAYQAFVEAIARAQERAVHARFALKASGCNPASTPCQKGETTMAPRRGESETRVIMKKPNRQCQMAKQCRQAKQGHRPTKPDRKSTRLNSSHLGI